MKKILFIFIFLIVTPAYAEKYVIDTQGSHAFIQFKIKHLGYSWLYGRFNKFEGSFNINRKDLNKSSVLVNIDTASVDSNHAERDKHLRSADFLDVKTYPTAKFISTSVTKTGDDTAIIAGNLTLHGVTKLIKINMHLTGEGKDPWGGYRMGFSGKTTLTLKDFGIKKDLGPFSTKLDVILSIEGIRQ